MCFCLGGRKKIRSWHQTKKVPPNFFQKLVKRNHLGNTLASPSDHRRFTRAEEFVQHENFVRFVRFGALDQNILLLGLLTGVGIDGFIHRRFGVAVCSSSVKKLE